MPSPSTPVSTRDTRGHQERFLRRRLVIVGPRLWHGDRQAHVRFVAHLERQRTRSYYRRPGAPGATGSADAWMTYGMADVTNLLRCSRPGSERPPAVARGQKIEALIGYCEAVSCRRQACSLFREAEHPPCGNCDNCRTPVPSWDGTMPPEALLRSTVRSTFRHTSPRDVLLGAETERISGWDTSAEDFGAAPTRPPRAGFPYSPWCAGLGSAGRGCHGGLSLAPGAAEVLRGTQTVRLVSKRARAKGGAQSPIARLGGDGRSRSTAAHYGMRCAPGVSKRRDGKSFHLTSSFIRFNPHRGGTPPPALARGVGGRPGVGRSKLDATAARSWHRRGERAHPSDSASADTPSSRDSDIAVPGETRAEGKRRPKSPPGRAKSVAIGDDPWCLRTVVSPVKTMSASWAFGGAVQARPPRLVLGPLASPSAQERSSFGSVLLRPRALVFEVGV